MNSKIKILINENDHLALRVELESINSRSVLKDWLILAVEKGHVESFELLLAKRGNALPLSPSLSFFRKIYDPKFLSTLKKYSIDVRPIMSRFSIRFLKNLVEAGYASEVLEFIFSEECPYYMNRDSLKRHLNEIFEALIEYGYLQELLERLKRYHDPLEYASSDLIAKLIHEGLRIELLDPNSIVSYLEKNLDVLVNQDDLYLGKFSFQNALLFIPRLNEINRFDLISSIIMRHDPRNFIEFYAERFQYITIEALCKAGIDLCFSDETTIRKERLTNIPCYRTISATRAALFEGASEVLESFDQRLTGIPVTASGLNARSLKA